jgi:hypothetical protein
MSRFSTVHRIPIVWFSLVTSAKPRKDGGT